MGSSLVTDTMPAICTGIMVMLSAGRSPAAPGVTHRMDTVPAPAMTTVSVASNWTPPPLSNSAPAGIVPFPVAVKLPTAQVAAVRRCPVLGKMYASKASPVRLAGSS